MSSSLELCVGLSLLTLTCDLCCDCVASADGCGLRQQRGGRPGERVSETRNTPPTTSTHAQSTHYSHAPSTIPDALQYVTQNLTSTYNTPPTPLCGHTSHVCTHVSHPWVNAHPWGARTLPLTCTDTDASLLRVRKLLICMMRYRLLLSLGVIGFVSTQISRKQKYSFPRPLGACCCCAVKGTPGR